MQHLAGVSDLVFKPLKTLGAAFQKMLKENCLRIGYGMRMFQDITIRHVFPQVLNSRQHQMKQAAKIIGGLFCRKGAQVSFYILIFKRFAHS